MEEVLRLLPPELKTIASEEDICEIRLRLGKPAVINRLGFKTATPFSVSRKCLDYVLMKAADASIYSVTDSIIKGFITTEGGIRIGLSGKGVYKNGLFSALSDISSLNIRIPREIKGVADGLLPYIFKRDGGIYNTLIFSLPGAGKTTLLRDICRNFDGGEDILIIDERNEISGTVKGLPRLDVGKFSDIYVFLDKATAFENGLRTLKPDVVVTDELDAADFAFVKRAFSSGVGITATYHADCIEEIKKVCSDNNTFFDLYIHLEYREYRRALLYGSGFKKFGTVDL